ncbi:hypothetical protein BGZ51_003180 [Haplosporangium sp. Z 767]|nr:hypothetical protein BGZ50_006719 [Haplosporangium sp. Z 11]KAF9184721.1 hypothetical protein BGZ51_003180 [Haplosporangium sp. Z 767]
MLRRSTAILFLTLSVIFLGLLSSVSAAVIPATNDLQDLGKTFQELRKIKGHFDGGEYNTDVDGFGGKKHKVMQQLHAALGKVGTQSTDVLSIMGPSDEIPAEILKELKRSEPQVTPPTNFRYLLYKWRGYHDYLWFRINLRTMTIQKSEWYFAYE